MRRLHSEDAFEPRRTLGVDLVRDELGFRIRTDEKHPVSGSALEDDLAARQLCQNGSQIRQRCRRGVRLIRLGLTGANTERWLVPVHLNQLGVLLRRGAFSLRDGSALLDEGGFKLLLLLLRVRRFLFSTGHAGIVNARPVPDRLIDRLQVGPDFLSGLLNHYRRPFWECPYSTFDVVPTNPNGHHHQLGVDTGAHVFHELPEFLEGGVVVLLGEHLVGVAEVGSLWLGRFFGLLIPNRRNWTLLVSEQVQVHRIAIGLGPIVRVQRTPLGQVEFVTPSFRFVDRILFQPFPEPDQRSLNLPVGRRIDARSWRSLAPRCGTEHVAFANHVGLGRARRGFLLATTRHGGRSARVCRPLFRGRIAWVCGFLPRIGASLGFLLLDHLRPIRMIVRQFRRSFCEYLASSFTRFVAEHLPHQRPILGSESLKLGCFTDVLALINDFLRRDNRRRPTRYSVLLRLRRRRDGLLIGQLGDDVGRPIRCRGGDCNIRFRHGRTHSERARFDHRTRRCLLDFLLGNLLGIENGIAVGRRCDLQPGRNGRHHFPRSDHRDRLGALRVRSQFHLLLDDSGGFRRGRFLRGTCRNGLRRGCQRRTDRLVVGGSLVDRSLCELVDQRIHLGGSLRHDGTVFGGRGSLPPHGAGGTTESSADDTTGERRHTDALGNFPVGVVQPFGRDVLANLLESLLGTLAHQTFGDTLDDGAFPDLLSDRLSQNGFPSRNLAEAAGNTDSTFRNCADGRSGEHCTRLDSELLPFQSGGFLNLSFRHQHGNALVDDRLGLLGHVFALRKTVGCSGNQRRGRTGKGRRKETDH